MRRRPELNRGHRPRAGARFAAGTCRVCPETFIVDRALQPWARSRTCSPRCAKVLANRTRNSDNCVHCQMVEDWRLQADTDVRAIETPAQDEAAAPVSFREYLTRWAAERRAEQEVAA